MPKIKLRNPYIWLIAYINSEYVEKISHDLAKDERFRRVQVCVPMVKVAKKKHKGEVEYKEVPMLFNYGFIKLPVRYMADVEFLKDLRTHVAAIIGFVKDPVNVMRNTQIKSRPSLPTKTLPYAIASEEEVANLLKAQEGMSIYTGDDISNLYPGAFVTLAGYPFDGIDAEIIEIHHQQRTALVKLSSASLCQRVKVSFDNLIYSVYSSSDELPSKVRSIEDLGPSAMKYIHSINIEFDGDLD